MMDNPSQRHIRTTETIDGRQEAYAERSKIQMQVTMEGKRIGLEAGARHEQD